MTPQSRSILIEFLLRHEQEIFYEINDYGELTTVFNDLIGRLPTDAR